MFGISNDIFNFIYIAVILLGGVTMTLTVILNAKERDRQHRAMMLLVGAIFIYMVIDFIAYYYLGEHSSGKLVFALITCSDVLFCLLTLVWIYYILVQMELEDVIRPKWVAVGSILYAVGSQTLSISLGRFDSYIVVKSGLGKILLQILDVGYVVFVIGICVVCIRQVVKRYPRSGRRTINLLFLLLLIGYMVWIAEWDYGTWFKTEEHLLDIYAMDPLILIYAILNIILIYYFYKKDPLRLQKMDLQLTREEVEKLIKDQYGLSARELDVMHLMNCGMSNAQIAAELSISENTVKRHASNIFKKTETQSRHELLAKISNLD